MKKVILTLASILTALPACKSPNPRYLAQASNQNQVATFDPVDFNDRYQKVWQTLLSLEKEESISPGDYDWYKTQMLNVKEPYNSIENKIKYLDILEKDIKSLQTNTKTLKY
jgi:hypothetical protein